MGHLRTAGGTLIALTLLPAATLTVGSFMNRIGYFNIDPLFSMKHWDFVLADTSSGWASARR